MRWSRPRRCACGATKCARCRPRKRRGASAGRRVVTDAHGYALYFSKRLIPHLPSGALDGAMSPVRLHVGVYAYRPEALERYVATPVSELETLEGLEQLRFLVAGIPVAVVEVATPPFALRELNNPEDVAPIEEALARGRPRMSYWDALDPKYRLILCDVWGVVHDGVSSIPARRSGCGSGASRGAASCSSPTRRAPPKRSSSSSRGSACRATAGTAIATSGEAGSRR